MSENFISWVKLFFEDATAAVNLNGSPGNSFKIKRGVRQGCPLAPYLSILIVEALNQVKWYVVDYNWIFKLCPKKEKEKWYVVARKDLQGTSLLDQRSQDVILQYEDNLSITMKDETELVKL